MVQRVVDSKYVLVNANAPGASLFFLSLFFFYFPSDFMNSHVNPNIYIYKLDVTKLVILLSVILFILLSLKLKLFYC